MAQKGSRRIVLICTDIAIFALSFWIALLLRFDGEIPPAYHAVLLRNLLPLITIKIIAVWYFRLYSRLWRYVGVGELRIIVTAAVAGNAVALSYMLLLQQPFPRSAYIMVFLLDLLLIGGVRMLYHVVSAGRFSLLPEGLFSLKKMKRVLVFGGGDAGAMIIREMQNHRQLNSRVVAVLDDDLSKRGARINNIPIIGGREDIVSTVEELDIQEVIIAVPSANRKEIKAIIETCRQTAAKIRIVPGVYELIDGSVTVKDIRDVEVRDILGREEVRLDDAAISAYIEGKTVLVTGAGGSIGSELCRQIAARKPAKLVMLDIYENTTYEVENHLRQHFPALNLVVRIASIRDRKRIDEILHTERPEVVFHAAAHKHVPLMESNPKAAFKNNVLGTLNLAVSADRAKVTKFVMISSDKAVNPTNIMGASKRLCEMVVQSINERSATEFVAVRFGNVLGSHGSVIPIFKRQIAQGGPVTVTHPEMTRYFMTIFEAVQLVLQAGSMAAGGEIFVLDMGEPVKILTLAEDMIRLSGLVPHEDIEIIFTGLRPGEKLYEELFLNEENHSRTSHNKIFATLSTSPDYASLSQDIERLREELPEMTDEQVKRRMSELVPTYTVYE